MPASIEHEIDRAGRFGQRLENLVYNAAKAGEVVYRTKNDDLLVSYWSLVFDYSKGIVCLLANKFHSPAFALMRPPGHHATADRAMGFCYMNQVAIAALAARRDFGAERVAIWDFDAHHCNGTEAILFGREGFLVCSVHQAAGYPGTGLHHSDNSLNWALPPQTPRVQHMEALRSSLDEVASFRPDLLLVSAGFDAYARDPITEMSLEVEDFALMGRWLHETGLPAAAILEGGYSPDLPMLVEAFLKAWAA